MKHYDLIVVGGGISGLTVALLSARQGKSVLLLEKAPRLGGAIARFRRNGIPFDVGFHFTGGFREDGHGILDDMLTVIGIRDRITPLFLPRERCHRIVFPSVGEVHEIPSGIERYCEKLKRDFSKDAAGIDAYFKRFLHVVDQTAAMRLDRFGKPPVPLEEDYVTLQEVLDDRIRNKVLQALLCGFCMCYGTRPADISFANHCRMAYGLQEPTARVENGGDAFVWAFQEAFRELDVEVRCRTTIAELADIRNREVRRFELSDSDAVTADTCVFTIHPLEILKVLPKDKLTPAFQHRVETLEPSFGFFSIFGELPEDTPDNPTDSSIFSIFPDTDLNRVLTPDWEGEQPLVMMFGHERENGKTFKTMTAFEVSFFEEVEKWQDTRVGQRGEAYAEYKHRRAGRIRERLVEHFPAFLHNLALLDAASMLTFRDHLNTPYGAAYGIKQKVGQINLRGKLPLPNLYAAGQSSLLPGIVGAMTSAFFVCRSIFGKEPFQKFIEGRLCH